MAYKYSDPWLFFVTFVLVLAGVLMVGSSTGYLAMLDWDDPSVLYWRQGVHALVGLVVLVLALNFPYGALADRRFLLVGFLASVGLLVWVFAMPALGGAHRWIILGPLRFQPSEMVKLFVVVYVAAIMARKQHRVHEARAILIPVVVAVSTLAVLIALEPDLGSALVLCAVTGVMLFSGGMLTRHLAVLGVLGSGALALGIALYPYRFERFVDFVHYWLGLGEPDHQLEQSLIALGSGGTTGVGFGQGGQKAFFLPASHTDFIYSIVGEELGMLGTVPLLVLFLIIFWRGMRTASLLREPFGAYLALGLTCLIVGQALMHIWVCLGLLPTTGLALPFISYGGSSLVASMAAMGLLINVSQECNPRLG